MNLFANLHETIVFVLIFLLVRNVQMVDFSMLKRKRSDKEAAIPIKDNQPDMNLFSRNQTQALIRDTKDNLLRAFGLRESVLQKGKTIKKRKPHDFMVYVFKKYGSLFEKGIPTLANTVRGCVDIDDGKRKHLAGFPHLTVKFDVSEIPSYEVLIKTELKLFLRKPPTHKQLVKAKKAHNLYHIEVLGVMPRRPRSEKKHKHKFPKLISLKARTIDIIDEQNTRWITFDVSSFVSEIKARDRKYVKFVFRVKPVGAASYLSPETLGFSPFYYEETKRSLLVLFSDDQNSRNDFSQSRKKRETEANKSSRKRKKEKRRKKKKRNRKGRKNKKTKNNKKSTCRLRKMFVDFSKFGWHDWVMSPRNYSANHCAGTCKNPISVHSYPTNHATIQSIVNSMYPELYPAPCCVPSEFQKLAMLYVDGEDRVTYKLKDDLIVKACACR